MLEVPRLPIRALGAFPLQEVRVHGSVGEVDIVSGRIPSSNGPETWAIALRSPVEADVMVYTFDVVRRAEDDDESYRAQWDGIIATAAGGIERTLRFASQHPGALGATVPPLSA